jgi:hypothetical protein
MTGRGTLLRRLLRLRLLLLFRLLALSHTAENPPSGRSDGRALTRVPCYGSSDRA